MHSTYSDEPSEWIMQRIGCPECYTTPQMAYELARRRGMQFVTLTDHDRIEGALEIAHLPGAFVSEEITTYFPEDHCKIHVVALNITEADHRDIQKVRPSIYDLVPFLNQRGIRHFLAHPLYPNNHRMDVEKVEKLLLMFKTLEQLNGHHTTWDYLFFNEVLDALTPDLIQELADKHNLEPVGPEPWKKNLTGGSDDHGMLCIGTTWTETRRVETVEEFLAEIMSGRSRAGGEHGTSRKLAHSIYSVAYNYYNEQVIKDPPRRSFVQSVFDRLLEQGPRDENLYLKSLLRVLKKLRLRRVRKDTNPVTELFKRESLKYLKSDPALRRSLMKGKPIEDKQETMMRFASCVSNGIFYEYMRRLVVNLSRGNLREVFETGAAIGAVQFFLTPYYFSYSHVHRERYYLKAVQRRFLGQEAEGFARVGLFTDTMSDVNGVVRILRVMEEQARQHDRSLTLITSEPGTRDAGPVHVQNFEPVGVFPLPEYPEIRLAVPPALDIFDYCERQHLDAIHIATPGPLGLLGILVSRIFHLPLIGTYHTDLPAYVMHFTNDQRLRDLTWRYLRWFYGLMDHVIVPSESTKHQLIDNGLDNVDLVVIPHGVDTAAFSPRFRDESVWSRFEANGRTKLLYVGRVSREKNLADLAESFRRLHAKGCDLELVVVGDGPYRKQMEESLQGYPATFTGYQEGEDLSTLFASADLFVFPSTTDTMGNVVLEAQASGLPVIVSDQGGPKECLLPGVTGHVYPGEDIDALTRTIEQMTADTRQLRDMGVRAREFVESRTHAQSFRSFWSLHENATLMDKRKP